ncbi:hypothetical protein KP509_13G039100 [Ceratopteris richardii]|uniref:Uncharacterized protein n=1 Tax=Ceratopteris richardii TaxID=49495 RepID=A0A8T2TEW1_CERRI|nr:hypothetical protein KP509_13G039100 [Ceratopteris richardii]
MLRQVCSHVQVKPFRRPGVIRVFKDSLNDASLMGIVSTDVVAQGKCYFSELLVPKDLQRLSFPSLSSMPSSTPCVRIALNLGEYSPFNTSLAPGHHIFVTGLIKLSSHPSGSHFKVIVRRAGFVQEHSPRSALSGSFADVDSGTLLALVSSMESRWNAYFHCPSEWHTVKKGKDAHYCIYVHKHTHLHLSPLHPGTPDWAKKRLRCLATNTGRA